MMRPKRHLPEITLKGFNDFIAGIATNPYKRGTDEFISWQRGYANAGFGLNHAYKHPQWLDS